MKLLKKIIYPANYKRVILALILVITVTTITMGAVYDVALKNVTLVNIDEFNCIDTREVLSTRKTTFNEFLEENGIIIEENDVVNKGVDEEISKDDVLIIRKGRVIELTADGNVQFLTVTKSKVGEALEEAGIKVGEQDVLTPDKDTPVTDRIAVNLDRYVTEYKVKTEKIEFDTDRVEDNTLQSGKTTVIQEGKNGEKEVKYSLLIKNGDVISEDVVSETVITEPVTRVVLVGTKKTSSKSSGGSKAVTVSSSKSFSYSKKVTMTATAYSKNLSENGGNRKTAYGLTPKRGIVAVDPSVIPLGTKLYIESADGGKSWTYGYCIAGDTGSAIKGNKVDLCMDTERECVNFGRRSAVVYILD